MPVLESCMSPVVLVALRARQGSHLYRKRVAVTAIPKLVAMLSLSGVFSRLMRDELIGARVWDREDRRDGPGSVPVDSNR